MGFVLSWWLILQIIGLAALPLAWRLFRNLPDRGYAFARPLGLLLVGYALWLGGMLGLLSNRRGTIAVLVATLGAVAWWLSRGQVAEIWAFLRRNRGLILAYEGMFLGIFTLWSLYKAYNPEIAFTEKPMEIAFLNAILRSERFPPVDPWLSGYSISYYYFGYLLMALLTRLSGIPSAVGYNLAVPLLMAFTVTGTFSVVYGLTQRPGQAASDRGLSRLGIPLLGAFFVAIIGNLEGFLELLHSKGVGPAALWQWLDIKNLAVASLSPTWHPVDNWWWWRASRVIHDVVFGLEREVIDEFPFFSFMLADLHPHVLALPFTLLALAFALHLFRQPQEESKVPLQGRRWWPLPVAPGDLLAGAFLLGALGFLNSWDFPTYTGITILAFGLRGYLEKRRSAWAVVQQTVPFALAVGGLGILLYLPFYLTFQSQAEGLGLVIFEKTRLRQYLVIFGLFLWAVIPLLARLFWLNFVALPVASSGPRSAGGVASRPASPRSEHFRHPWPLALSGLGMLAFLIIGWWTAGLIIGLVGLVTWGLLIEETAPERSDMPLERAAVPAPSPVTSRLTEEDRFALLLVAVGLLLTLFTEFAFIKDSFGTRMNTVFKFYYQAWVLLAVAAAYAVGTACSPVRATAFVAPCRGLIAAVRYLWLAILVALVLAGSYYPLAATYTKANFFSAAPTLDGLAHIARYHPDEYAAIQWLNAHVKGTPVILEAVGGQYSDYARISAFTGLPTVLGWPGHEGQWRGNYMEPGRREPEVDIIYRTMDKKTALNLLQKYNVSYVVVGRMEREKGYDPAALAKFRAFMDVAFESGGTVIYKVRE